MLMLTDNSTFHHVAIMLYWVWCLTCTKSTNECHAKRIHVLHVNEGTKYDLLHFLHKALTCPTKAEKALVLSLPAAGE